METQTNGVSLAEMSGEGKRFGKTPNLVLNEIKINGKTGKFVFRDIIGGKIKDADGNERYAEQEIGDTVSVVFLKVRRKLFQYRDDAKQLSTNEHNTKHNVVTLYGEDKPIRSTNDNLRAKFPGLRTQQVVYAIYDGQLVRIIIKGSSLGSKTKAPDVADFYSYLGEFKKDGKDEHFYEYETILKPAKEKKAGQSYYCITFVRGDKLSQERMPEVEKHMVVAYEFAKKLDEYYQKFDSTKPENHKEELPTVNYDSESEEEQVADEEVSTEDDINPEDIPF